MGRLRPRKEKGLIKGHIAKGGRGRKGRILSPPRPSPLSLRPDWVPSAPQPTPQGKHRVHALKSHSSDYGVRTGQGLAWEERAVTLDPPCAQGLSGPPGPLQLTTSAFWGRTQPQLEGGCFQMTVDLEATF